MKTFEQNKEFLHLCGQKACERVAVEQVTLAARNALKAAFNTDESTFNSILESEFGKCIIAGLVGTALSQVPADKVSFLDMESLTNEFIVSAIASGESEIIMKMSDVFQSFISSKILSIDDPSVKPSVSLLSDEKEASVDKPLDLLSRSI